jgi:UDP-N-acetylglucosamine 2-epimerase
LKLLIGGSSSKFFHLQEFSHALEKFGIESKLVFDVDYADGFPSRRIGSWLRSDKKFKNLIQEFKPDIILVDRQKHFGLAATKTNIPLLVHLRGNHWEELKMARDTLYNTPPKRIALQKWEEIAERCFRGSKIILPICNFLTKIVRERYPDKAVETLYQGISPSNWYDGKGMNLKHPCVGLLQSAIIWEKTRELLTLEKVLKAMPDVMFYWVGDGPYKDKILPILEKHHNFKWLGHLEYPDQVRQFLSEIDVYALISGIDMSPLTLQEAQLMKKPVVATNVGGIPELMKNGDTGFLVDKQNSQQIIEKLSILLNDKKRSHSIGEEGRKFVEEKFAWEKIAQDFVNIIHKHLN